MIKKSIIIEPQSALFYASRLDVQEQLVKAWTPDPFLYNKRGTTAMYVPLSRTFKV